MHTVISAFQDRQAAQRAVDSLVESGFDRDDIHIEQSDDMSSASASGSDTSINATSTTLNGRSESRTDSGSEHEHRGVMDSIGHFFASLFGQDEHEHAGVYSEAVRRGNSIVVVDARDEQEADRATSLLQGLGAINVHERAEQWRTEGWQPGRYDTAQDTMPNTMQSTQRDLPMEPMVDSQRDLQRDTSTNLRGSDSVGAGREGVLDVVQEELRVGKRSIDRGGVRVVQRVSEQPVREMVRLREERAVVERVPVNREATQEDLSNFREGTIEVREMTEEPVVAKTARVVEEVRVGKDVREREEQIEDTVRRKDVDVQRIEGEGSSRTSIERERAMAADRGTESADGMRDDLRDPDGSATSDKKLTLKNKTKKNL